MKAKDYFERLDQIRQRDIETYKYHKAHPEAKMCNARDRRAGYNSRQSVHAAIKRIEAMVASGAMILEVTA
jgi:hypothetical protein